MACGPGAVTQDDNRCYTVTSEGGDNKMTISRVPYGHLQERTVMVTKSSTIPTNGVNSSLVTTVVFEVPLPDEARPTTSARLHSIRSSTRCANTSCQSWTVVHRDGGGGPEGIDHDDDDNDDDIASMRLEVDPGNPLGLDLRRCDGFEYERNGKATVIRDSRKSAKFLYLIEHDP